MGLFFFISLVMSASPEPKVLDLWLRAKTSLVAELGYPYSSLLSFYAFKSEDSSSKGSSAGPGGPAGSGGFESRIYAHCRMVSVRKNFFNNWEVHEARPLNFRKGQMFRSRLVVSRQGAGEIYLFPVPSKDLSIWDSDTMFRIYCDSSLWKIPRSASLPPQFEKSQRLPLVMGENLSLLQILLQERFEIEASFFTIIEI